MILTVFLPITSSGAPFTPGNVVIYRVGDGVTTLTANGSPVFLDEYTPTGGFVQSVPMPTTVVGDHRRLVASGRATAEGGLTRSADGRFLIATGYDSPAPYTSALPGSSPGIVFRTIAKVDLAGSVDTTTSLRDYAYGGGPRSATSADGNAFWMLGSAGGILYAPYGTTGYSNSISNSISNYRQIFIHAGQLFASTDSSSTVVIAKIGTGLPTSGGQSVSHIPGYPIVGSAYAFHFADLSPDVAGIDTLYVADDEIGLRKFSLVGGTWVNNGAIGTGTSDYRGLTATVTGENVTLYATRNAGGTGNIFGGGEFVTFVDTSGYNGAFTGTPTLCATAKDNSTTAFRGIALAPSAAPPAAPVFTLQPVGISILSGTTATLTAAATGIPPPTIQWYQGEKGDTSNPISGANNRSLVIPFLGITTRCWARATNSNLETADSESALITVVPTGGGGLHVKTYDTTADSSFFDPVNNLMAVTPSGSSLQTADLDVVGNFPAIYPGLTNNETFSILWEGWFDVSKDGPGDYTFGTNSNDGSAIFLDLNHDGDFGDPGELIVDNNYLHPANIRVGEVTLRMDSVRIAIGYYENLIESEVASMVARFRKGKGLEYAQLDPINGTSGYFFTSKPIVSPGATGLWDFASGGYPAEIQGDTLTWHLPLGTPVNTLAPTFSLSPGATSTPPSGTIRNFTTPQTYLVTAQNGTTRTYTVTAEVSTSDGLTLRTYDTTTGTSFLNPISNLKAVTPSGTKVEFGNFAVTPGNVVGLLPGITDNSNFAVLWEGWMDVSKDGPGTYTFGVESADGGVIYLDLNGDGDYADAGELIVNNNFAGSPTIRLGSAVIERDAVRIAMGYFEGTTTRLFSPRFKKGSGLDFEALDPMKGSSGHFYTTQPLPNPSAANLWGFGTAGSPALSDGQNITWQLPPGTSLAALAPTFSVSAGANANPPSGTVRDFTTPQSYAVTSAGGALKTYVVTAVNTPTTVVSYRLGEAGSLGPDNLPLDSAVSGIPGGAQDMTQHFGGSAGVTIGTSDIIATGSSAYLDTSVSGLSGWYGADLSSLPKDNFAVGIFVKAGSSPAASADILALGYERSGFKLSHGTSGWEASSHDVGYIGAAGGAPASFIPNAWAHLALVRKAGSTTFYINGIARGSFSGEPTHGLMRLCLLRDGNKGAFKGQIDEARVVVFHSTSAVADILQSLHGGFTIPPTISNIYQWNGPTSENWATVSNWAAANGPNGVATGPAPTSGNFIHRLSVNNKAGNPLNYLASLGDTVYANPTGRGLVIGSGLSTGGGTMIISGGSFSTVGSASSDVVGNSGNTGNLILEGGTFLSDALDLGNAGNGIGRLTIQSGTASISTLSFNFNNTGSGFVNLNGGILEIAALREITTSGNHVFNFNGGLLKTTATMSTVSGLTRANVRDGGVRIDTGAFNLTISQQLLHSNISGDAPIDGGLTKWGEGTLTLSGSKSYTGDTVINAGTLAVSSASFANASDVIISESASLHLNHAGTDTIGQLIINGVPKAVGIWGAPGTAAANTDPHLSGTGTLTVFAVPPAPDIEIWTAGGDRTNWEDAANWSNGLPLADDKILISGAGKVLFTSPGLVSPPPLAGTLYESLHLRSGELIIDESSFFALGGGSGAPSRVGGFGEGPAILTLRQAAFAFNFGSGLDFGGTAGGDAILNFNGNPPNNPLPAPLKISPSTDQTAARKSRVQWNFLIAKTAPFLPWVASDVALATTASSRPNQIRLDIRATGPSFALDEKFTLIDYSAGTLTGLFLTPDGTSTITDDSIFSSNGYAFRIDYNDFKKITATVVGVPGNHPPLITSQPAASKSVISGSTVNLVVTAIGSPAPTYQWYQGPSGDTSTPILGATSASFTSPALISGTSYWVEVRNITDTMNVVASTTATISISPVPLPNASLLHRWSFDNHYDSVGGAHLTLVGDAALAGGQLELPGSSLPRTHYGSVNIGSSLAGLSSTTVESWFTLDVLNVWSKVWMFGRPNGGIQPGLSALEFTPHSNASIPRIVIDPVTSNTIFSTDATPNPGTMALATQYHVAVVYDAPANQMRFYINGSLSDSASMGGFNVSQIGATLENFFGASVYWPDPDFGGRINEIRIWNRPLTTAEISTHRTLGPDQLPAPEISLEYLGGAQIVSGGGSDFGIGLEGVTRVTKSLQIRNSGSTVLEGIQVSFSGENAGNYSTSLSGPPFTISPGGNAVFDVSFHPLSEGAKNATLRITSNDSDENPYLVNLTGTGQSAIPLATSTGSTSGFLKPQTGDFYRVSVPGPGILITWTEGSLDTSGNIYDSSGGALSQDLDSGPLTNFRTSAKVTAGDYIIRVAGEFTAFSDIYDSIVTGPYTLHTRFIPDSEPTQISYLEKVNDSITLGITTRLGIQYEIQASEDLKTWTPTSTVTGSGAERLVTLAGQGGFTKRFFRVATPIDYPSWAAGFFPGDSDPNRTGAAADPDRDGLGNSAELVIGGNPTTTTPAALLPDMALLNTNLGAGAIDYFLFTYRRTDLSVRSGVGSGAQFTTDLAGPWMDAVNGTEGVVIQADDDFHGPGIDRVRVHVPRGGKSKVFGRMKAVVP